MSTPFVAVYSFVQETLRSNSTPILLAVGLVVLLVEGHQVRQAEPVVRSDEVDGVGGPPVATPLVAVPAAPPVVLGRGVRVDLGGAADRGRKLGRPGALRALQMLP